MQSFIAMAFKIICTIVLFSSLIAASQAASDAELTEKYRFSKVLDDNNNYKLYWSFNRQEETITFAVRVGTTGWIGFGLSPNGQMPNSDVVVGWVDTTGTAHFHVSKYNTIAAFNLTICSYAGSPNHVSLRSDHRRQPGLETIERGGVC